MTKVLFVDDEPYILDAYLRILRHSTFECFTLSDSTQVFQHPALNELDIIVVDQQMPGVTGTEILLQLQKNFPHIKSVLVSGDINVEKENCSTITFDAALQKPLTKAHLIDCLLSLI
jgi:DNA-binding NtrC family response regulator